MRFASIGGSNAASYAGAGKAVADSAAKVFAVQRKTGPDYAGLSKVAMKTASDEKIAGMKAAAKVAEAQISTYANVTQTGYKVKAFKEKENIKNSLRKAGGIAAIGKMAGAAFLSKDNTDGREYPKSDKSSLLESYQSKLKGINDRENASFGNDDTPGTPTGAGGSTNTGGSAGKAPTGGNTSLTQAPSGTMLTGNARTVADAIAKYESGDWGYEAFNQGGRAGGTRVVGKSGSHKQQFGTSLTDMTLGDIFHRQNTEQRGLSFQQHLDQGGLHAVGRYQFIGPTLQDEVRRMGLDHSTKFTPEVQDQIFLSHVKRVGNISPWVGPSQHYSAGQKAHFNQLIKGL